MYDTFVTLLLHSLFKSRNRHLINHAYLGKLTSGILLSSIAVAYVLVHVLSVDRLSLNFKSRLKLIAHTLTSMKGQKRQLYDFFRNWFLFEIYEAFDIDKTVKIFLYRYRYCDIEFEKSIWQGLDNADESAPTCFLYWLTIYMIKRNTYFIVLSIYLLINFVR